MSYPTEESNPLSQSELKCAPAQDNNNRSSDKSENLSQHDLSVDTQSITPVKTQCWNKIPTIQPINIKEIQQSEELKSKASVETHNKALLIEKDLASDTEHFLIIDNEKVFIYEYEMKKEFYNMNDFITDKPAFNDCSELDIAEFVSPWYYCLRNDARPELPVVVNLWTQCSHMSFCQPPKGLNVKDFIDIINYNKIAFTPRIIPKEKVKNFSTFLDIKEPFKFEDEVVDIYEIARHFAKSELETNNLDCLWSAASIYLGFLMYPLKFYYYPSSIATVFLNSSKYIREHLTFVGSNLLKLICSSCNSVEPKFIMMNSLWGSYISNLYGWPTTKGKREAITLENKYKFLVKQTSVSITRQKKPMNIFQAAKYLYRLPEKMVAPQAARICKKYGFSTDTLNAIYQNMFDNQGKISPALKIPHDMIYCDKSKEPLPNKTAKDSKTAVKELPKSAPNSEPSKPRAKRSQSIASKRGDKATMKREPSISRKTKRSQSVPPRRVSFLHGIGNYKPFAVPRGTMVIDAKTFKEEPNVSNKSQPKKSKTRSQSVKKTREPLKATSEEPVVNKPDYPRNIILNIAPLNKVENNVIKKPHSTVQFAKYVQKNYKIPVNDLIIIINGKQVPITKEELDLPNNSSLMFVLRNRGGSVDETAKRGIDRPRAQNDYINKILRLAKKYDGDGIPVSAFINVNYNAGGNTASAVFTEASIIARNNFLNKIGKLPYSPFPDVVKYFDNGKIRPSLNFIEDQFEEVPKCPWDQLSYSKVTTDQLEYMNEIIPQRKFAYPYVCESNYDMKANLVLYTRDKTVGRLYELAFNSIKEVKGQRYIGMTYLNSANIVQEKIDDCTYKVDLSLLYSGPTLIKPNGDLNLTNKYVGMYLPTRRTNGYARLNYPIINALGTPAEFMEPYLINLYEGISDNSLHKYEQEQKRVQQIIGEHILCPGTISGEIVRFTQCMYTRHLAVPNKDDPYWVDPTETMHFIPIFDIRTMSPTSLGRLYAEYPLVKVNMKASTGLITNNQSRNLLVKISDGKLCQQWFALMKEALQTKNEELLKIVDSLALVAEMKPKDEIIERIKMFVKTRVIYVLNSFTQAALNVMFTGAETEFMARARGDLTFPLLLGIDPAEWLQDLIDELRKDVTVFDGKRFWYYSYSDNVYCYDHKDKLLYSFDGVKMESSIRGTDVLNLLATLTNYLAVSEFTLIGEKEIIDNTIHRLSSFDVSGLKAYVIDVPETSSYHHSPFALDGKQFDLSSAYDRIFVNKVVFYLKSDVLCYKYNEEDQLAKFTVLCCNKGFSNSWWKHYITLMSELCENLQCFLGESMLKSHFLPSGAQFTALVNSYKTLGSVLYANKEQTDPSEFCTHCKCWLAEVENVADLKPIINNDHKIQNIRLDFLGLDATCELGYWSLVLREGALFSGPAYGDYIAKRRDLRVLGNQFSMYCSAILNGLFNRPYYCSIIIGELGNLSMKIMLNDQILNDIVEALNQQIGCAINIEFFNKPNFWKNFINLAINRLKLEDFKEQEQFVDNCTEILQMPEIIDINQPTLEEMLKSKYPLSSSEPIAKPLNSFIENEDLSNKVLKLDAKTIELVQTFARMVSIEYKEFYFRIMQKLTALLVDHVSDDSAKRKLKQNMSTVLYS